MSASVSTQQVVSIGYEGRSAEDLILALQEQDVHVLVDVRLNPISRKPGLSKTRLAQALHAVGIRYLHQRPLGNPQGNREAFRAGNVLQGRAVFQQRLLDDPAVEAMEALGALTRAHRVAVLCFERAHDRCHRQVVVDNLLSGNAALQLVKA